ncbi:GIY-YIG nuclease family protein [Rhodococcus jostii]|uniref:GIY-YIG nuclease family protein n=1 Tax=Rhodococcus jostii TaxID=132919 RepID=UPI0036344C7C
MSMLRRQVYMCQEHALLVWSIIDEQVRESRLTPEEIRARRKELSDERAVALRARRQVGTLEPEKSSRKDVDGWVYYLRVGKHIKIGFASNLESRLRAYPPDTELLAVEKGTMKLETERHREFAAIRAHGREWYWPKPWLMEHIGKVAENGSHTWCDEKEWRRRDTRVKATPKPGYWR